MSSEGRFPAEIWLAGIGKDDLSVAWFPERPEHVHFTDAQRYTASPHPAEQERDTLLAGLKAEAERQRKRASLCTPTSALENHATETADRLEHLIKQAGGEQ